MSLSIKLAVVPTERARGRNKAPVFVLGCPRSGTTLLYHMILSAGDFAVYRTESKVFNLLLPRFGDLGKLRNRQRLMRYWLDSFLFQVSGLDAAEIEAKVLRDCKRGDDFLRIIMEEIARKQGVGRWAECTPDHLLLIPQIKKAIPEALIIHIIRDGRDVALSLAQQGWIRPFPWDPDKKFMVAALYWAWTVRTGREHGRMQAGDYLEVHYEQLLQEPRETLARLGRFIDHDLDYDRIRQVGVGSVSEPNTSFEEELGKGEFRPVGRWKERLSAHNLEQLEALIGDLLAELGYTLASTEKSVAAPARLRLMRALYQGSFRSRFWLKVHTPLGRLLTDTRQWGRAGAS